MMCLYDRLITHHREKPFYDPRRDLRGTGAIFDGANYC